MVTVGAVRGEITIQRLFIFIDTKVRQQTCRHHLFTVFGNYVRKIRRYDLATNGMERTGKGFGPRKFLGSGHRDNPTADTKYAFVDSRLLNGTRAHNQNHVS